jgi:DegV family protein with EDD domain
MSDNIENKEVLTTELLYGMILSGAKNVIHTEGELNNLNVFPVADRDTGTNLASMMRYIVDNLTPAKDTKELLQQLSQHGLMGCCGNSGLIFSQFFYGLTQHEIVEKFQLKIHDFVEMMSKGYKSAYDSVSNPKPGTILTVMEEWVAGYRDILKNAKTDLYSGFNSSIDKANVALKDTMNQLEVLKKNHVVDAGAQGFVNFITGMQKFLTGSEEQRNKILADHQLENSDIQVNHEFEDVNEIPDYRFCFESVIRTQDINSLNSYQDKLNSLGDSIVIGKGPNMLKLHIHTNQPEVVTNLLTKAGDVIYQKIDDMLMQYTIANAKNRSKVAIVADTMADIPEDVVSKYNIYRIPLQVKVDNNTFLDKVSINYQTTLKYLSEGKSSVGTAAPSAAIVARTFQFLDQFYESIIVIPVGKSMSSTHDVILNQSKRVKNKLITVIDSGLNSAPLGMLVTYAGVLASSGEYNHEEIVVRIEAAKRQSNVVFILNSLDGLIRSGRVGKSLGVIGKLFKLKPILHIDNITGKPKVIGAALTKSGGWRKLCQHISELHDKGVVKSISIVHSDTKEHGNLFAKYVKRHTGLTATYVAEISSISGVHTDSNSYSIGYMNNLIKP